MKGLPLDIGTIHFVGIGGSGEPASGEPWSCADGWASVSPIPATRGVIGETLREITNWVGLSPLGDCLWVFTLSVSDSCFWVGWMSSASTVWVDSTSLS